ncbi:hypothetical protein ACLKA6_003938 [Drosophila palustris]
MAPICSPDNKGCYFQFKNDCYLVRENCVRVNRGLKKLAAVSIDVFVLFLAVSVDVTCAFILFCVVWRMEPH